MHLHFFTSSVLGVVFSSFKENLPSRAMSASQSDTHSEYTPPDVWVYESSEGSKMTMNRPTAGARFEKDLPLGRHPIQLYSLGTPNGQKVTILLEELLELGIKDAEYDAWMIDIMESDQFGSQFVELNPNSKIPAMRIYDGIPSVDKTPLNVFESGSILLHLAERFDAFIPKDPTKRTEVLNWLFWQMGSAPYVGGGFGHFYTYATVKQKYPIDRFTMETKRQLDVLDKKLANSKFIVGDEYTIADIAIFPWYGQLVLGKVYPNADRFLNASVDYPNVIRWTNDILGRAAVQRGLLVNCPWSKVGLVERHDASDFKKLSKDDK
jgi:GSH-dependent disulfide-bond oxidoreductase